MLAIAGAMAALHVATNGRYGFHRDELQVLSDAQHLGWGFVAVPPVTRFLERISLSLFGLSLVGLRLFSVLAQAAIVVSGLMARELGGRGWRRLVWLRTGRLQRQVTGVEEPHLPADAAGQGRSSRRPHV